MAKRLAFCARRERARLPSGFTGSLGTLAADVQAGSVSVPAAFKLGRSVLSQFSQRREFMVDTASHFEPSRYMLAIAGLAAVPVLLVLGALMALAGLVI